MKRSKSRKLAIALALATVPFLMGCGSNSSDPAPVGYIPGSSYGYPGIPGSPIPLPGGVCIPINQQIPFVGNNAYYSGVNLLAGAIPNGTYAGQHGQLAVGGGGAAGPYTPRQPWVDGQLSLNIYSSSGQPITPMQPYPTVYPYPQQYPYPNQPTPPGSQQMANISGVLNISPQTQQDIIYQTSGGYGTPITYPTYPGYPSMPQPIAPPPVVPSTVPCVSGIAIETAHSGFQLYLTRVYLYLNNTTHGYKLGCVVQPNGSCN